MTDAPDLIPAPVRIAANHVNVFAGERVTPEAFLSALTGGAAGYAARAAVEAFIDEADPAEFADLVACEATTFPALRELAVRVLPPLHPNRVYLGQFAA